MGLQPIHHRGPPLDAVTASGELRGLAGVIAHGHAAPPDLPAPAEHGLMPGRVGSGGRWQSASVRLALGGLLGHELAPALGPSFEWYLCQGAFFHNDAHFDGVLFGVWCLCGPPAEVVFPRVGVRVAAAAGDAVVFDPFEVHGVLAPGRESYRAEDYAGAPASVFIGFELTLTDAVASTFRLSAPTGARALSSRTRISAATGEFE